MTASQPSEPVKVIVQAPAKPMKAGPEKSKKKKKASVPKQQTVLAPSAIGSIMNEPTSGMRRPVQFLGREEAVGPIVGTTTPFAIVASYAINPGLSSLFPWMSTLAGAFNLYRFRKLRLVYKNSTSTSNTGVIVIGFNPDPNDAVPTSLAQIENYDTRLRITSWLEGYVDVPRCDLNRLNKFIVRKSIVPGELATYDLGSIYIAASGNNSSSATVGELWIEYDLEFFSPVVDPSIIPYGRDNTVYTQTTPVGFTSGNSLTIPWNSALVNPFGLTNASGSFTGITGALIVYSQVSISTTAFTSGSLSILKNASTVISAFFPAPLPNAASGFATCNIEGYVSLIATDILTIAVNITGTGNAAPSIGGQQTAILVFTAA